MLFETEKKDFLSKKDKSKKGKIDDKILPLVNKVNSFLNYYTTSSCAGRIKLFVPSKRKQDTALIFVKHDKVTFNEVKKNLEKLPKESVWFRQESFIIHVCCQTIENAQKLLDIANKAGLKRAGIITTKNKIIVELISTEHFDTIISQNGELLVNDSFLRILISEANKKLETNFEKLKKFWELL
jgi:tRNA wybutosine-synthesizing protein 3